MTIPIKFEPDRASCDFDEALLEILVKVAAGVMGAPARRSFARTVANLALSQDNNCCEAHRLLSPSGVHLLGHL